MKQSASVVSYFSVILKHRRKIIKIFFIFLIGSTIVSFIIPIQFTAITTILPPVPQGGGLLGFMGADILSGLQGVGEFSSLLPGATSLSDLYAAILESGTIKSRIIQKYNLMKIFKAKTFTDASKQLSNITKISISPEGIITVSVTWFNKQLAADIANSYIEELDKFNKETAMTTGKKYRMFVEQRLKETSDSLSKAEEALKKFQEQHRTVALDIEIENAIATIAKLKSEIILREVQKGAFASASGFNNPYVTNIDQELRELKRQLSRIEFGSADTTRKEFGAGFSIPFARLPELSLEYARLLRDVKIQEAVFELLTQQYEQAKIMEAKDTPTVQILDKASPPEKKSIPKRGRIIIFSSFWGLIISIFIAFYSEWLARVRQRSEEYTKVISYLQELKDDVYKLRVKIISLLKFKKPYRK